MATTPNKNNVPAVPGSNTSPTVRTQLLQKIVGLESNPIVGVRVNKDNKPPALEFTTKAVKSQTPVKPIITDRMKSTIEIIKNRALKMIPNTQENANSIANIKAVTGQYGKTINNVLHRSLNLSPRYDGESNDNSIYTFFDRYYSIYPDLELTNLCHYVFLTRPDLNIVVRERSKFRLSDECSENATYTMLLKTQKHVLTNLSLDLTGRHDFMPIATPRIESIQLPDYSLKNYSINQPYTNLLLPYASHGIESQTGGTFDITFREFYDLSFHKMFQAWLTYIDGVTRNLWEPKSQYIDNNQVDYAVSVYDIICAPDARTILYWNKYTGAFPINNPNSSLSFNLRDKAADNKLTIQFQYFLSEALKPEILSDFNMNAKIGATIPKAAKEIDTHVHEKVPFFAYGTGYSMVECPFITKSKNGLFHELRWKPRTTQTLQYDLK